MHILFFGTYIPPYGLLISIGFICALFLGLFLCRFLKLDYCDFLIISSVVLASGFTGAKILYVIVNFKRINFRFVFSDIHVFTAFINSGFVFYGGLIGGAVSLVTIHKFFKINVIQYQNILVPSLAICHAFGRIGCACAGCCYGKPTAGHFYVVYESSNYAPSGVKLIPVQGIEAAFLFLIFLCMMIFILKRINIQSIVFYLITYSIFRFIIEFFRDDSLRGKIFFLSTSQFISIVIFISAISYLMIRKLKMNKQK